MKLAIQERSSSTYIVGVDVAKIVAMLFVVGIHIVAIDFPCAAGGGGKSL